MFLILLRHAEAHAGLDDETRALTPAGGATASRVGRFLAQRRLFGLNRLAHSTLLRARQTAELVAAEQPFPVTLDEVDGLEPEADPRRILALLERHQQPCLLVGHNPHLSALASLLLTGSDTADVLQLPKCGMVCLAPAGRSLLPGHCRMEWMTVPGLGY